MAKIKVIQEENPVFLDPPTGEPTGICEVCGQRFQQYLNPRTNAYSEYKKCPKHKKTTTKPSGAVVDSMKVTTPYTPHPAQQIIHNSTAKYKIINAGNRFGKDRATIMECIKYFIDCLNEDWRSSELVPRVYWWVIAPVEKTARQFWRELKMYFPKDLVLDISESDKTILTIYGGVIEIRSAYNPEDLVGVPSMLQCSVCLAAVRRNRHSKRTTRAWARR